MARMNGVYWCSGKDGNQDWGNKIALNKIGLVRCSVGNIKAKATRLLFRYVTHCYMCGSKFGIFIHWASDILTHSGIHLAQAASYRFSVWPWYPSGRVGPVMPTRHSHVKLINSTSDAQLSMFACSMFFPLARYCYQNPGRWKLIYLHGYGAFVSPVN